MTKPLNKREPFDAQNYKWRFDVCIDGPDAEPIYRIALKRWIAPNSEEEVLVTKIEGEMAHAFIQNDVVVNAYIDALTNALQASTI